ncbi:MAG: hypothetical protein V1707_01250 [bacterium]
MKAFASEQFIRQNNNQQHPKHYYDASPAAINKAQEQKQLVIKKIAQDKLRIERMIDNDYDKALSGFKSWISKHVKTFKEIPSSYNNEDIHADALWGVASIPHSETNYLDQELQLKASLHAWERVLASDKLNRILQQTHLLKDYPRDLETLIKEAYAGKLAELAVESVITRLQGFPEAKIKVRPGNDFDDQILLIDFYARANDKERGINVMGIQLTIDPDKVDKKKEAIERVKKEYPKLIPPGGIKVVFVDAPGVHDGIKAWAAKGQGKIITYQGRPGGPELYLKTNALNNIIFQVFDGLLSDYMINKLQRYGLKHLEKVKEELI